MAPSKPMTGQKLTPASDAGQSPPTEANPVRQHYQMACHESGGSSQRTKMNSRQFNRGMPRKGY